MLYSYEGQDKDGNKKKGYINADSRIKAMSELKYSNGLVVVFYLKEKIDNQYINKLRLDRDKLVGKVETYVEGQKEKIKLNTKEKEKERPKFKLLEKFPLSKSSLSKPRKWGLHLSDNEMEKLSSILQKLKVSESSKEINPQLENTIINIFKDTSISDLDKNSFNYQDGAIKEKPDIRQTKKEKYKKEESKLDWSIIETNNTHIDKRSKKLKLKDEEIILFSKRLALMLRAGLALVKSLTIIEVTASKNLSIILNSIIEDIQQGSGFSNAISKFPHQFDSTYVSLILIGESTGDLANCLEDVVSYKERGYKVQKKISSATLYPKILGGVLILVLLLGSIFFIPMFENMFIDQGIELPTLTKMVFAIANSLPQIIISLIVIIVGVKVASSTNVNIDRFFKYWISKLLFKVPIINSIILTSNMYTFSSTVSLMLKNGLRLNEVLKLTIGVIGNIHIKNDISSILNYVVQGMPLSEAMDKQKYFDNLLSSIVLTGEESGKLDEALHEISVYYDGILNNKIDTTMELIQPVSTLLVAVMAAPIIIAIYLPIFDMTSGMGM